MAHGDCFGEIGCRISADSIAVPRFWFSFYFRRSIAPTERDVSGRSPTASPSALCHEDGGRRPAHPTPPFRPDATRPEAPTEPLSRGAKERGRRSLDHSRRLDAIDQSISITGFHRRVIQPSGKYVFTPRPRKTYPRLAKSFRGNLALEAVYCRISMSFCEM